MKPERMSTRFGAIGRIALVVSFAACVAHAEVVTSDMALAAADAWAERNAQFEIGNNATNVITVCDTNAAHTILWHQVSMAGGGCLIIAPVTEIEPIVMALERDPGELPEAHPLRGILTLDMRGRLRFLNLYPEGAPPSGGRLRLAASSSSVTEEDEEKAAHKELVRREWAEQQQSKWEKLRTPRKGGKARLGADLTKKALDSEMKVKIVLPGFGPGGRFTHWNQGGGVYNMYTPGGVPCGCVATAAAAMMQYFRVGEKDGQEIEEGKADAGTTYLGNAYASKTKGGKYDWENPDEELYGRVTYDAGVAVGMGWNRGGSGALEAATATAFKDYFGFQEVRYVGNPRPDQYEKLIYAQCRSGAPVGMGIGKSKGGSGHSVVAVGYGIDDDDVERVRVFLGWGGSGDGWYALPYINTKSTLDGDEDLYDILDGIITMIGYENDNVVPVFGRMLPYINPPMTIGDVEYSPDKDEEFFGSIFTNGFFGARVSASGTANRQVKLSCAGKSGSVTIGPAARKNSSCVSDGNAICKWVPDPIFFPLLNSEVALSFADAREKCIASFETTTNKPVFAFSGNWDEQATTAAWDYLYWLDTEADDATKEAFTNKYIVLCVPYSLGLSSESDGKPSIGVFDGRAISADENKMWSFYNGRLSYWTIGSAKYTNDVDGAGFPYTNVVETVDGPYVTYSYTNMIDGVSGEGIDYVTGELITNELIRVMEVGLTNFLKRASGISLKVEHNCPELPGHPDPDYGFYENAYTNGVTISVTSPEYATNAAQTVEFRCLGWTLSSTNGPAVVTNEITVTDFTPVRDGSYTITWLWETNAVKITREVLGDLKNVCAITPNKGDDDWYKIGDVVTFTATGGKWMTTSYDFNGWGLEGFLEDDEYSESGNLFVLKVSHPAKIQATFSQRKEDAGTFNLTVTNYGIKEGDPVPETLVGGVELPYETVTNLTRSIPTDVMLAANSYTVDGIERPCLGWRLMDEDGNLLCAIYNLGYMVVVPTNFVKVVDKDNTYIREGNGGGLVINGNDIKDPDTGKVIAEEDGLRLYELGETSPLSWIGINPNAYGITNGASVTLQWLWKIPREPITFDLLWNDDLDNLHIGETNILSAVEMALLGVEDVDDLTVRVPIGWKATLATNAVGDVIATLSLDPEEHEKAMGRCQLTIYPKDGGTDTYVVKATIPEALRGFWYVLQGANDLTAPPDSPDSWKDISSGTYESGTPRAQAKGTVEYPYDSVELSIDVTPGVPGAGAKRFYRVVTEPPPAP